MLISALSRAVSLYYISDEISRETITVSNTFVYIMVFFPDMIYNLLYIILTWYYFTYFVFSHIKIANDQDFFLKKGK